MNVELINPFINATVNALSTMAQISPRRGIPYIKKEDDVTMGDISAVIGITGKITGWAAVSFQKKTVLKIATNMLSEEKAFIDAMVRDAVGEIVNMIAGGAKGELSQKGFSFKIAIPTVIVGENHILSQKKDVPCIAVPFTTDSGEFTVEVCLKEENVS